MNYVPQTSPCIRSGSPQIGGMTDAQQEKRQICIHNEALQQLLAVFLLRSWKLFPHKHVSWFLKFHRSLRHVAHCIFYFLPVERITIHQVVCEGCRRQWYSIVFLHRLHFWTPLGKPVKYLMVNSDFFCFLAAQPESACAGFPRLIGTGRWARNHHRGFTF